MQIKIISFNTAGIINPLKIKLVWNILNALQADVVLLQEVQKTANWTHPFFNIYENFSDYMYGTLICAKKGLNATNCRRHESGRIISVKIEDITIINVYAPSGQTVRRERDKLLNEELIPYVNCFHTRAVLGGDFNAI